MRRNYKSSIQEQRNKIGRLPREDYEDHQRKIIQGQLKSLQCSSVQQINPTNQSYQNSWLQKLVTGMDQQKAHVNNTQQLSYGFMKKYCTKNIISQDHSPSQSNSLKIKKEPPQYSSIPISIQYENNRLQAGGKLKHTQDQRVDHNYKTTLHKYNYQIFNQTKFSDTQDKKVRDLNQSGASYGRIKRGNKHKQFEEERNTKMQKLAQKNICLRPYQSAQKRERFTTQYQPRPLINDKLHQNNYYQNHKYESIYKNKTLSNQQSYVPRRNKIDHNFNSQDYQRNSLNNQNKYEKLAKQLIHQSIDNLNKITNFKEQPKEQNKYYEKQITVKQIKSQNLSSKKFKQDDIKMDEMAKKLNSVLQNINKKSKLLSHNNSTQQSKKYQTPQISSFQLSNEAKQKNRQLSSQSLLSEYRPQYRRSFSSIGNLSALETQKLQQTKTFPSLHQTQIKQKYTDYVNQQLRRKENSMKKSLGMSKHESSSEINSQVSPRKQFLNLEFRFVFDLLDKNKSGVLTKNNCALEKISDEIKYIFGAIFSKIKYKNETIMFKQFLQQCLTISQQFQFQEIKEIFNKSKVQNKIINFKLNQKQAQSQRWNTQTNIQEESKRSSGRSEVVKKYQFGEPLSNIQNRNCLKVHWTVPPLQRKSEEKTPWNFEREKNLPKSPYINKGEDSLVQANFQNKKLEYISKKQLMHIKQKQNMERKTYEVIKQTKQETKDFQKMCQNLNNKLNNYLTAITKKQSLNGPRIPLQFSQLSKHWASGR